MGGAGIVDRREDHGEIRAQCRREEHKGPEQPGRARLLHRQQAEENGKKHQQHQPAAAHQLVQRGEKAHRQDGQRTAGVGGGVLPLVVARRQDQQRKARQRARKAQPGPEGRFFVPPKEETNAEHQRHQQPGAGVLAGPAGHKAAQQAGGREPAPRGKGPVQIQRIGDQRRHAEKGGPEIVHRAAHPQVRLAEHRRDHPQAQVDEGQHRRVKPPPLPQRQPVQHKAQPGVHRRVQQIEHGLGQNGEALGEALDDEAAAPMEVVIPLAFQHAPKPGQPLAGGVAERKGVVVRHIGRQAVERQHGRKHHGGHGRRQLCRQRGGFPFRFQGRLLLWHRDAVTMKKL